MRQPYRVSSHLLHVNEWKVVSYESETWSLILREECRLRVFGNRVLKRTFGPTREEVTGSLRKFIDQKLHDLYLSPTIVRVIKSKIMRWTGNVARMGEGRGV
jgi:hypothetical protein